MMKLGIGTAQFGMRYGISNTTGQCPQLEIIKILETAKAEKINVLDTAAAYGTSEETLGRHAPESSFKIVTKIAKKNELKHSFLRLKRNKIYALMIHHPNELLGNDGHQLWETLQLAKAQGQVEKIGVSVYDSVQIEQVLEKFAIDIIQLPVNLLDQRVIKNNDLVHLKNQNIEIHARSTFLQGLILLNPDKLAPQFLSIKPRLKQLHLHCEQKGMTILQAALGFVHGIPQIDKVIVGMTSHNEFLDLIKAAKLQLELDEPIQYAISDDKILNPSRW